MVLKMKKFKKEQFLAFSMIELMISLVTISVITAAATPIVTKKIAKKDISLSNGGLLMKCNHIDEKCTLCHSNKKCIMCSRTCASNQYADTATCKCKSCSSKYGSTCVACDDTQCLKCSAYHYIGTNTANPACKSCEAGYSCDTVNRTACPVGFYQDTAKQNTCKTCWESTPSIVGSYTSSAASTSCKTDCGNGKYVAKAGATGCSTCPAGSACPGGKIDTCPAGTYSAAGATSCTPCPDGKWSDGNASGCSPCPEGHYCINGVKTPCPAGEKAGAGATRCSRCGAKKWSDGGTNTCYNCPAGYKCTSDGVKSACGPGTYSNAAADACTNCSAGYYSNGSANTGCAACSPGQWSDAKASSCYTCPVNYACNGAGSKVSCTGSKYAFAGASKCTNCSSAVSLCTQCSVSGTTVNCSKCNEGYIVEGNVCVEETNCWWANSTTTVTLPSRAVGKTVYSYACGGGGASSTGGFTAATFTPSSTSLTVNIGGAGSGFNGGGVTYISNYAATAACGGGGNGGCRDSWAGKAGSAGGSISGGSCTGGAGGAAAGTKTKGGGCSHGGWCSGGAGTSCQPASKCESRGGYFAYEWEECASSWAGTGGNGSGANTTSFSNYLGTGYCTAGKTGRMLISLKSISSHSECRF